MSRTVTVGLDGSQESLAAAEWAAREARLRGLPLRLVNVWEPQPYIQAPLLGGETVQHWAERIPRDTADELRLRHPDVEITADQVDKASPVPSCPTRPGAPSCWSWAPAA